MKNLKYILAAVFLFSSLAGTHAVIFSALCTDYPTGAGEAGDWDYNANTETWNQAGEIPDSSDEVWIDGGCYVRIFDGLHTLSKLEMRADESGANLEISGGSLEITGIAKFEGTDNDIVVSGGDLTIYWAYGGIDGTNGTDGVAGANGTNGIDGTDGDDGADGAQGIQGKIGPQGPAYPDGITTNLMCFSTDQTIGSQGKQMGLGQQAGAHSLVGVISPFPGGAQVMKLVVKVSQGKGVDGWAQLYHDRPLSDPDYDEGFPIGPVCELHAADNVSVCEVPIADGILTLHDSLSVFVVTDSGNFEGASACVLIDPDGAD